MFLVESYLYNAPPWGRPLDIPLRGGVVPFEETPLLQQQFSNWMENLFLAPFIQSPATPQGHFGQKQANSETVQRFVTPYIFDLKSKVSKN